MTKATPHNLKRTQTSTAAGVNQAPLSDGVKVNPPEFARAWVDAEEGKNGKPYTAAQHRARRDVHDAIARAFAGLGEAYRAGIHQAIATEHGTRAEAMEPYVRGNLRKAAIRFRAQSHRPRNDLARTQELEALP